MDDNFPTEADVSDLLSRIQPQPGPGFHQKMANQPWIHARGIPSWAVSNPIRAAATIGIFILLVLGISLLSPSLDTLANRFTQFFLPSPSSQAGAAFAPLETSHPVDRFNLTIREAETLASFGMNTAAISPQGFDLIGATFDELRGAIILHYTTNSGGLVMRISQQPVDSDYQGIGLEAVIERVPVGPNTGEFVAGGWTFPEVESEVNATQSPNSPQAVWNASVNLQTLRWTDGEFLYEIILAGGDEQPGYLDKNGLITLANRMY